MYYAYNKKIGCIPCTTREEAIHMTRVDPTIPFAPSPEQITFGDKDKQELAERIKKQIYDTVVGEGVGNYYEYFNTYEAVILYIINRGNREYPEYLTKKKIGEIFTITMLRWYIECRESYTHEKPIKVGKPPKYGGNIGFPSFDEYYENIRRHLQTRQNNEKYYVLWTEIPEDTIRKLVNSKKMIKTVNRAVRDAQYPKNCTRVTHNLYKHVPKQYKMKKCKKSDE